MIVSLVDVRMALRNVFRQRARTALTLAIIGAGVAGLIASGGFVEDSLNTLRESTIHAQLGHVQVYKEGYYEVGKRRPYQYLIDRPQEIEDLFKDDDRIRRVMARLAFAGILNNGKSDLAIVGEGIEAEKEAALGTQMQIIEGRRLAVDDRFGVMVGEGVAAGAGLHVGDPVTLLLNTEEGALNSLEFTVVGVFRTFSKDYDARAVRVALADAQSLVATKGVNAIVFELKHTAQTDAVAAALKAKLGPAGYEVKTWLELADFYEKTAALFERQFAFLQAIILLSVLLSVANSVNMTIFERTGEFGTLMALGTRGAPIFRLLVMENVFVALMGSVLGVLMGIALAWLINALHITMPPPPNSNSGYYAGIKLDAAIIATAFFVGLIATPLTALWPAHRASKLKIVDALRMN